MELLWLLSPVFSGAGGLEPQCWPNRWAQESSLVGSLWALGNSLLVGVSGTWCQAELPGLHLPLHTGQARLPVAVSPVAPPEEAVWL